MMLHDALSLWNEAEAQLYIKTRHPGFVNLHQARGYHLRRHDIP